MERKCLTLQELKDLVLENLVGFHIWVRFLPENIFYAAITDRHDHYGVVAVWCAGTEKDFLQEADYGTTWLAYLDLPEGVTPGERASGTLKKRLEKFYGKPIEEIGRIDSPEYDWGKEK